jgi:hypothetical protein
MRLFATHVDVAPKLDAESNRVQQLEQQARKLLEENERYINLMLKLCLLV